MTQTLAVKPQPYFFITTEKAWSAKLAQLASRVVTFWLPAIWLARADFATITSMLLMCVSTYL